MLASTEYLGSSSVEIHLILFVILSQDGTGYFFPCHRWLSTSEDDGQICRELVPVEKSAFERRKSRRMSRSGSRVSLNQGDSVDLEQKGTGILISMHSKLLIL